MATPVSTLPAATMNPSHPPSSASFPGGAPRLPADDLQIRNWLRLRRELSELHARLEYLKLMLQLGVSR